MRRVKMGLVTSDTKAIVPPVVEDRVSENASAKLLKIDSRSFVESGVRRWDRGTARRKPRYDDQTGFVHVDMSVTKAPAVFPYRNADGSVRREFRPAEHVFSADNMERMSKSPLTLGHPPVAVTTKNVGKYSVGHSDGSSSIEDGHFWTGGVVQSDEAIDAMENGVTETSAGYTVDLVFQSGVWVDSAGVPHPYDAIQTNHRHNHTSILPQGRAETTGIAMDRSDAVQVTDEENMAEKKESERRDEKVNPPAGVQQGSVRVGTMTVGLPIEKAKLVGDAIQSETKRADALEAERDAMAAELNAAKEKLASATSEEELHARVDARRSLIEKASSFITDADDFEAVKGKTDLEIKTACVAAYHPDLSLDGKTEQYIVCMFDLLKPAREDSVTKQGKAVLGVNSKDSDERSILRARIDKAQQTADEKYKSAIPGGVTSDGKTGSRTDELHG